MPFSLQGPLPRSTCGLAPSNRQNAPKAPILGCVSSSGTGRPMSRPRTPRTRRSAKWRNAPSPWPVLPPKILMRGLPHPNSWRRTLIPNGWTLSMAAPNPTPPGCNPGPKRPRPPHWRLTVSRRSNPPAPPMVADPCTWPPAPGSRPDMMAPGVPSRASPSAARAPAWNATTISTAAPTWPTCAARPRSAAAPPSVPWPGMAPASRRRAATRFCSMNAFQAA